MYLVEQQYQAVLQSGWAAEFWVSTSSQKPQQGVEDGCVLQQGLLGLTDKHLKQLEQRTLAVWIQTAAEVPLKQPLQNILCDHELQDGAHRWHAGAAL